VTAWPNPETLLVAAFDAWQADLDVEDRWTSAGVTPADLQEHLPFVTVSCTGGPNDDVTRFPIVVVEVLAATYDRAMAVAQEIELRLLDGFIRNVHGLMDGATQTSAHQEIPHPDPEIRRVVTTYQLATRRLATA
jgi:hypothetical protein